MAQRWPTSQTTTSRQTAVPAALAKPTIIIEIHSTTWGRAGDMHGIRNWDLFFLKKKIINLILGLSAQTKSGVSRRLFNSAYTRKTTGVHDVHQRRPGRGHHDRAGLRNVSTAAGSRWDCVEYELTPVEQDVHAVALNGVTLAIEGGPGGHWSFPSLRGKHVPNSAGLPSATLIVAAQGYSFVIFPNTAVDIITVLHEITGQHLFSPLFVHYAYLPHSRWSYGLLGSLGRRHAQTPFDFGFTRPRNVRCRQGHWSWSWPVWLQIEAYRVENPILQKTELGAFGLRLRGRTQCVLLRKRKPNATTPWGVMDKYSPDRMLGTNFVSYSTNLASVRPRQSFKRPTHREASTDRPWAAATAPAAP